MYTYLAAVRDHRQENFWSFCAPELSASKTALSNATSFVRRFLALDEGSEEASTDDHGSKTYTERTDGYWTSVQALKEAWTNNFAPAIARAKGLAARIHKWRTPSCPDWA